MYLVKFPKMIMSPGTNASLNHMRFLARKSIFFRAKNEIDVYLFLNIGFHSCPEVFNTAKNKSLK